MPIINQMERTWVALWASWTIFFNCNEYVPVFPKCNKGIKNVI